MTPQEERDERLRREVESRRHIKIAQVLIQQANKQLNLALRGLPPEPKREHRDEPMSPGGGIRIMQALLKNAVEVSDETIARLAPAPVPAHVTPTSTKARRKTVSA